MKSYTKDIDLHTDAMKITVALLFVAYTAVAQAAPDADCTINRNGDVKTYDDTHLMIFSDMADKMLLSRWAGDTSDPCKFRLRAVPKDGAISWLGFSIGVHGKNSAKYWINYAFERQQSSAIEVRGWKIKKRSGEGTIHTSDLPYFWTGGDTSIGIYHEYDGAGMEKYIINSTTCDYEFAYHPDAPKDQSVVQMSISRSKYQDADNSLRGICQNANQVKMDDYTMCRPRENVRTSNNALELIQNSCWDNDSQEMS